jgi:hypothetical protein
MIAEHVERMWFAAPEKQNPHPENRRVAAPGKTQSLPLGIAPEVVQGKQKIVEHQFMHFGWGIHLEEIIKLCKQFGVAITLSS